VGKAAALHQPGFTSREIPPQRGQHQGGVEAQEDPQTVMPQEGRVPSASLKEKTADATRSKLLIYSGVAPVEQTADQGPLNEKRPAPEQSERAHHQIMKAARCARR